MKKGFMASDSEASGEEKMKKTKLITAILYVSLLFIVSFSEAANIAVLSNQYAAETATDFNARLTGHTFTGIDVSTTTPTLTELQAYGAILLFEDGTFGNSQNVGNVVAQYANGSGGVILGTFYDQDRSDANSNGVGWGALESIDPNTTDTRGCSYTANTLNAASIVPHPLTTGVTSLFSGSYSGGNQPKAGTVVLANWTNLNFLGNPDPAIAYRITGNACVIHIGIAPHYSSIGTFGANYGGNFYQVWQNAADFAVVGCNTTTAIPGTQGNPIFPPFPAICGVPGASFPCAPPATGISALR